MSKNNILFLLASALIVITGNSCEGASDIQTRESDQLFELLCDSVTLSNGILDMFENEEENFQKEIKHEILLLTNSCYKELIEKREKLNDVLQKLKTKLQRNNKNDYLIHIYKPALRKLEDNCRKVFESENLDFCKKNNSNKRSNFLTLFHYFNTLKTDKFHYSHRKKIDSILFVDYGLEVSSKDLSSIFLTEDHSILIEDEFKFKTQLKHLERLYNKRMYNTRGQRHDLTTLISKKEFNTNRLLSLDLELKKIGFYPHQNLKMNNEKVKLWESQIELYKKNKTKIDEEIKKGINVEMNTALRKEIQRSRTSFQSNLIRFNSIMNQVNYLVEINKKMDSNIDIIDKEIDLLKHEYDENNERSLYLYNLLRSNRKSSSSKSIRITAIAGVQDPTRTKTLEIKSDVNITFPYWQQYDIQTKNKTPYLMFSNLKSLTLFHLSSNEKWIKISLNGSLELDTRSSIVNPSIVFKGNYLYCLVNVINGKNNIKLLTFKKNNSEVESYTLLKSNEIKFPDDPRVKKGVNPLAIDLQKINDGLIFNLFSEKEREFPTLPLTTIQHVMYTYSPKENIVKYNSQHEINYDENLNSNFLPMNWLTMKHFEETNSGWLLSLPDSKSTSGLKILTSINKGKTWQYLSN